MLDELRLGELVRTPWYEEKLACSNTSNRFGSATKKPEGANSVSLERRLSTQACSRCLKKPTNRTCHSPWVASFAMRPYGSIMRARRNIRPFSGQMRWLDHLALKRDLYSQLPTSFPRCSKSTMAVGSHRRKGGGSQPASRSTKHD